MKIIVRKKKYCYLNILKCKDIEICLEQKNFKNSKFKDMEG